MPVRWETGRQDSNHEVFQGTVLRFHPGGFANRCAKSAFFIVKCLRYLHHLLWFAGWRLWISKKRPSFSAVCFKYQWSREGAPWLVFRMPNTPPSVSLFLHQAIWKFAICYLFLLYLWFLMSLTEEDPTRSPWECGCLRVRDLQGPAMGCLC